MSTEHPIVPDPAAEFGAALSIYTVIQRLDLPPSIGGDVQMRECARIGVEFEAWACAHVNFDDLDDVWPYLLEEKFGNAVQDVCDQLGIQNPLTIGVAHWPAIATKLSLPLHS